MTTESKNKSLESKGLEVTPVRKWYELLPVYLSVIVTIVYAYLTYRMVIVLERTNEPLMTVSTSSTHVQKATEEDEYWVFVTEFKNGGTTVAKNVYMHTWYDEFESSPRDLTKIELDGPYSIGPTGSIQQPTDVAKAVFRENEKREKNTYKHSLTIYENASGTKFISGITERLIVEGKSVLRELIQLSSAEVFTVR